MAPKTKAAKVGSNNLSVGRAKLAAKRAAAKEQGFPTASERWAQLLDGTLTVRDLSDKEIKHGRPRNVDGTFGGKARRLPSHIHQQFADERLRRAKSALQAALPIALEEMKRILNDPEAKDSDKIKLLAMVFDRNLGKTPETVRYEAATPFDQLLHEVVLDRDLADLAGEGVGPDGPAR